MLDLLLSILNGYYIGQRSERRKRGIWLVECLPSICLCRFQRSLLEFLDTSQLNCLNESAQHTLKGILETKAKNTTENYLLSDADEQLLLNLHVRLMPRV
jgi:hypothetical protein